MQASKLITDAAQDTTEQSSPGVRRQTTTTWISGRPDLTRTMQTMQLQVATEKQRLSDITRDWIEKKNILTLRRRVRQQELEAKLKQTHPSICHFRSPPRSDIPETLRLQRVKISHDLPKFNLNTNTVSQKQEHAKFSFNQQHLQRKQNNGPQYLRKGTQASTWYTTTGCMIVATSRCKILWNIHCTSII